MLVDKLLAMGGTGGVVESNRQVYVSSTVPRPRPRRVAVSVTPGGLSLRF